MKAAIFDMDGTLLDSNYAWSRMVPDTLAAHGLPCPDDILKNVYARSFDGACRFIVENYLKDMTAEEFKAELGIRIERYFRLEAPLKPGVEEYLKFLAESGVRLCIATMTDERYARMAFSRLGIEDCFEFVYSGADKRSAEPFLLCAEKLGCAPEDCVVFDDAAFAARVAREAGFAVCGIRDKSEMSDGIDEFCDLLTVDFLPLVEKRILDIKRR